MQNNNQQEKGFTLLELMLTIAIIAILAAIAIPSYINYTRKTYYSELVRATEPYKLGVAECINETGTFSGCNSGTSPQNGIPPSVSNPPNPRSVIGKITVNDGVITAIPNSIHGFKGTEFYILKPSDNGGIISWTASGPGVTEGLAK